MKSLNVRTGIAVAAVLVSFSSLAHHSVDGSYDRDIEVDIGGTITSLNWRNPHISMQVEVISETDAAQIWDIETTSISSLRRRGMNPDFMAVGDQIRVFGIASRSSASGMHALNVLQSNGEEFMLEDDGVPHWPEINSSSDGDKNAGRPGDVSAPELGIFRTWSVPTHLGGGALWNENYPLTDSAKAAQALFDRDRDSITATCDPKGMPTLMEQPYPISFEQSGDDVVLHIEEYDSQRTIHMGAASGNPNGEQRRLGYSVGEWDDRTLVVTTTDLSWRHFDGSGIPISADTVLIERFRPSEDGSRLDYSMTVIDPETFTEPVVLNRLRLWYPDAQVSPYDCNY